MLLHICQVLRGVRKRKKIQVNVDSLDFVFFGKKVLSGSCCSIACVSGALLRAKREI